MVPMRWAQKWTVKRPSCWVGRTAIVCPTKAAAILDFADDVAGGVFDGRQGVGEGARAHAIALGRNAHRQGFVRTLVIVDEAPIVEGALANGRDRARRGPPAPRP